MLRYSIQLGLFIGLIFIISSSTFIKMEEGDKLYVIQLSSSPNKIWTDAQMKSELIRFKSLESYGFIYETSYLNSDKVEGSKLFLGTYENYQTAKIINEKITNKGFETLVQLVYKRKALSVNHSIQRTVPKNGKLSKTIEYSDLENEGGTGTILIKHISENMYSFTMETYDKSLNLPNNSFPTPAKNELEITLSPPVISSNNETETIDNTLENPKKRTVQLKDKFYNVLQGDTLYSLSKKFNISEEDLKELNNLKFDNIRIGQRLQIRK
jgi:LysM repeat protein